jgi:Tol biopolymer transport system component
VNIDGTEVVRYDVSTNAQGGRFPAGRFPIIDVSPDGTQIAFDYAGLFNRMDICVFNINIGEVKNLTKGFGDTNRFPTWSPDGKKLAFTSLRKLPTLGTEIVGIYVMDADGSNITLLCADAYFPVWQR